MANASNALAECEQHFKSENAKEKSELLTAYKEKLAEKDRLIAAQDEELKVNMSMDWWVIIYMFFFIERCCYSWFNSNLEKWNQS